MRRISRAFSLIEIVIALGVVSVAVIAMFGLFPVGYRDAQESRRETRAAFVAEQISDDLRNSSFTNATILSQDANGELKALAPFSLAESGMHYVAGDEKNNITREATVGEYDAGVKDSAIDYLARVKVTPTNLGDLSRVEIEVSAPAAAPLTNRSRHVFFTLMEPYK